MAPVSKVEYGLGRILAIDYGVRRTGIAVTDSLQLIANGLTTVETKALLPYLQNYVSQEDVSLFVVGLPMQTNGQESETMPHVRAFVGQLQKTFPSVPIEWWDERYTSVLAHRTMLESGIGKMKRRDKALVDEISACIILQGYMESKKFKS